MGWKTVRYLMWKQTAIKSRKKWQERATALVCFSRALGGRGNWSASCCSPQCLTRPSCLLSAGQQHSKSFLNSGYLLGLCLMVLLHISCLPYEGFSFPSDALGPHYSPPPSIYAVWAHITAASLSLLSLLCPSAQGWRLRTPAPLGRPS